MVHKLPRQVTALTLCLVPALATACVARAAPPAFIGDPPMAVLFLENHKLAAITGDQADMPFLNAMWNHTAGFPTRDFTHYFGTCNEAGTTCTGSMPNYEAVTTGAMAQRSDTAAFGVDTGPDLFSQISSAGQSWANYAEGIPGPCSTVISHNNTATDGQYVMRHTPALLDHHAATSSQCATAVTGIISYQALPQFTFITPNICDDMHGVAAAHDPFAGCRKGSNALERRTDSWVRNVVTRLVAAGATVFITFDESRAGKVPLYAVMAGAGVTPGRDSAHYDHYSLLAGIEKRLGYPRLANAARATPVPWP